MKYFHIIILLAIGEYAFAQTPINDDSWSEYYDSDFSGDPDRWGDGTGTSSLWDASYASGGSGWVVPYPADDGWGDEEYEQERVKLNSAEDRLLLIMDEEIVGVDTTYLSGALRTNAQDDEPKVFGFGYYEAEIKLPIGNGLWPAFWTFNYDASNPTPNESCLFTEEIDIMESLQTKSGYATNPYQVGHNLHWPVDEENCPGGHLNGFDESAPTTDHFFSSSSNPITSFNKYAVEWSPEMLIWYFNDVPFRELYFHEGIPQVDNTEIILSFQLNIGEMRGIPQPVFPCTMEVKHVKVWELAAATNCSTSASHENITSQANLDGYDHDVRYSVKINPSTGIVVSYDDDVVFRAKNNIEVTKNFTVAAGGSATFLIHGCPP